MGKIKIYNKNNDDEELSLIFLKKLSYRERKELSKQEKVAIARKRMVFADVLIEEGLMRKRFRREE